MLKSSIERQTFDNHVFTRNTRAKQRSDRLYFKRKVYVSRGKYKKEILHRVVWSYYNGPIPDDCIIHHIDKDPANNDISNLECIKEHLHARTRHKSRSD